MAASHWRSAMNSRSKVGDATRVSTWTGRGSGVSPQAAMKVTRADSVTRTNQASGLTPEGLIDYSDHDAPGWLKWIWQRISARHALVLFALIAYPFVATPFFTFQILAQALVLGIIALSLTFLGGYGGMVSLAQWTVAGAAGYMLAVFGSSSVSTISLNWPWWLAVLVAIAIATVFGTLIGWLAVRTEGIYTIMITLAVGVAFYYLTLQNHTLFNGFQGFSRVEPPKVFDIYWRDPVAFYFLALVLSLAAYCWVKYLVRSPFGIALQGVRDNPRRMNSLGYNVTGIRVMAYVIASFLAAIGGVLLIWYNSLITPSTIGTGPMIAVLIIAVMGGMSHPIGAFIGAITYVLLQNFAIDLVDRERFNLVIGGVFLAIVLFSPDGLIGIWKRIRNRFAQTPKDW
jgi:branched-chain amino acid transport system permease protein